MEETLEAIGTVLANIALLGATAFVLSYALFFKWHSTEAGRSIMGFVGSIVLLTFLSFVARTFRDSLAYDWLRVGIYALVATAAWGLLITLWRTWSRSVPKGLVPNQRISVSALEEEKRMLNDKILGTIRTFTPSAVGAMLAWLVAKIPAVEGWLANIDAILAEGEFAGATAQGILTALAIGGFTALYYWLVRTLSPRWPWLESLLGSKKTPVFMKQTEEAKVVEAVPVPEDRDVIDTAAASVLIADAGVDEKR